MLFPFLLLMAWFHAAFAGPAVGDGSVFAPLPAHPGYPEDIVIDRGRVFVTTPAVDGTAGTGPSEILIFQRATGQLTGAITVQGENLSQEHALSGLAADAFGNLYALNTQLGVLRFKRQGQDWIQEAYSTPFPQLGFLPPLPNDAVFDEEGNLYVSDSLQAMIWRIPKGGGTPQPWFTDPRLIVTGSQQLGPNGVKLTPARDALILAYSGGPAINEEEQAQPGVIYRLPLVESPTADDLEVVFTYPETAVPDGLGFTRKGDLYVSLAGHNTLSVLTDLDDVAQERNVISGPLGSPIPFMQPANFAFCSGSLLVVNHAIFLPRPDAEAFFAILDVFIGEQGDHLVLPLID